jgi:hypothetical protein
MESGGKIQNIEYLEFRGKIKNITSSLYGVWRKN